MADADARVDDSVRGREFGEVCRLAHKHIRHLATERLVLLTAFESQGFK